MDSERDRATQVQETEEEEEEEEEEGLFVFIGYCRGTQSARCYGTRRTTLVPEGDSPLDSCHLLGRRRRRVILKVHTSLQVAGQGATSSICEPPRSRPSRCCSLALLMLRVLVFWAVGPNETGAT